MKKLLCTVLMLCMLANVLGIAEMAETEPAAEEEIELFFESDVEDDEEDDEEDEMPVALPKAAAELKITVEQTADGTMLSVDAEGRVLWQMQEGTDVSAAVEDDWVNVAEGASIVVAPETDTLYRAVVAVVSELGSGELLCSEVVVLGAPAVEEATPTPNPDATPTPEATATPEPEATPAPMYELSGANFLAAGKSMTIAVKLNGKTVKASTLDWTSSNKDLATVSAGKVTAAKDVKESEVVTITATSKTDKNIKGWFTFFVSVPVTKVTVTAADNKTVIDKSETVKLSAAVEPKDQACPFVTWKSSNPKIAAVDILGYVTPKKVGKVTITATAADGTKKSDSIVLTVVNTVKGLELTGPMEIGVGKSVTLKPIITPNDATNKKLTWASDSKDVTVSKTGVVKVSAKAAVGTTATITVKSVENPNLSATCTVTVTKAVTAVKLGNVNTVLDCVDGNTLALCATCEPEGSSQNVTWKSSNPKIATVDASGNVTPKKVGKVTITATATDGSKKSAKIVLNVVKKIKGLTIKGPDAVAFGKSIKLTAVLDPIDATNKKVTWKSSDPKVATVSTSGVVKANAKLKSKTQVTITATSVENNSVVFEKTIDVCPLVKSVAIDKCVTTIAVDEPLNLSATCTPENAGQGVTWKSSNAKIAAVDAQGNVTALKVGKVTITATAADGSKKSAKVVLNVVKSVKVQGVTIEGESTAPMGSTVQLTANVTPVNAEYNTVTWTSSNEEIATVDENGLVTPKKVGEVTITATANDGSNKSASKTVSFVIPVESVAVNFDGYRVRGNSTVSMSAAVLPENATIKNVLWSSSDENVATVDKDGKVKLSNPADMAFVTITATSAENPSISSSRDLWVIPVVERITLQSTNLPDNVNTVDLKDKWGWETLELTAIGTPQIREPEPGYGMRVMWSVSDEDVAEIVSEGYGYSPDGETFICSVRFKTAGTVTITVADQSDSEVMATRTITVTDNPDYTLSAPTLTVSKNDREVTIRAKGKIGPVAMTECGLRVEASATGAEEDYAVLFEAACDAEGYCEINEVYTPEESQYLRAYVYNGEERSRIVEQPLEYSDLDYSLNGYSAVITGYHGEDTVLEIPSSINGLTVTSIGEYAFNGCTGLTSVTISEGVTTIGNDAFYNCTGLTSVSIPETVTTIGIYAFNNCTGLTEINVAEGNSTYCSVDGVVYTKDVKAMVVCPLGKETVVLANGLASINAYAFYGCTGLTSVTIPKTVTSIGNDPFRGCTGLTEINVAKGNSNYCSVDGIVYTKDMKALLMFPKARAAVTIPGGVTTIGGSAFYDCDNLTSVTIPEGVTTIGEYAFYDCENLTSVTIPDSVTMIGYCAFSYCKGLAEITIPGDGTFLGAHAFDGCSGLKSVYLNDNISGGDNPYWTFHYVDSVNFYCHEGTATDAWLKQSIPADRIIYQ